MNDELSRAISIAQTAHDHNDGPADNVAVAIGALIRAVEILAGYIPAHETSDFAPRNREPTTSLKVTTWGEETADVRVCEEASAIAVLCAFGRPNQLTTSAVTDALERVADTANIGARRLVDDGIGHDRVLHEIWHDAIRDELSRLQTEPSQPAQTNAVDALRRVMAHFVGESHGASPVEVVRLRRIVDDELAQLGQDKPTSDGQS